MLLRKWVRSAATFEKLVGRKLAVYFDFTVKTFQLLSMSSNVLFSIKTWRFGCVEGRILSV